MNRKINIRLLYYLFYKTVGKLLISSLVLLWLKADVYAQDSAPCYLRRSLNEISETSMEVSTGTAHYKPIFGAGDAEADIVKGVKRFGYLTITPVGRSGLVNSGREEQVYYVLDGQGTLHHHGQQEAIIKNDFFYLPVNTKYRFSTNSQNTLHMLVMGYEIPGKTPVDSTTFQLANADQVEFQTLEQLNHGSTSRFQLLLGTTESKRDRLAAAYQINSLFVIDFDPGGTNIPHRHESEEEIYFVLQGNGQMVAGETPEDQPKRYAAKAGDAFFFSKNCLVGFYSDTQKRDTHTRILAIRSKYPGEVSTEE